MSGIENPSAFPYAVPQEFHAAETGMSLRDWFAGQALVGLCANRSMIDGGTGQECDAAAWFAFELADAMLAARSGK